MQVQVWERLLQSRNWTTKLQNILGFAGNKVSATTVHLCCCNKKVGTGNVQLNKYGWAPMKLYLQIGAGFGLWVILANTCPEMDFQRWLHIRITWKSIINPDIQTVSHTNYGSISVVQERNQYFFFKTLQVIWMHSWERTRHCRME